MTKLQESSIKDIEDTTVPLELPVRVGQPSASLNTIEEETFKKSIKKSYKFTGKRFWYPGAKCRGTEAHN